jgi:hypothetical protein
LIETDPYRRAQLFLWGARAAATQDPALARRWRDELAHLDPRAPGVDELQARGKRKHGGRPHVNLMMVDAY